MTAIYLSMYDISIKTKHTNKDNTHQFDEVPVRIKRDRHVETKYCDILDIFDDLFNSNINWKEDRYLSDSLRFHEKTVHNSVHKEEGTFSGFLELGEYGNRRRVFNRKTKEDLDDAGEDDAVAHPFYFCFTLHKNQKIGCLILEEKLRRPIISTFEEALKEFFDKNDKYNHLIIKKIARVPNETIENVCENGEVNGVEYIIDNESIGEFDDNQVTPQTSKFRVGFAEEDRFSPSEAGNYLEKINKLIRKIVPNFGNSEKDKTNLKVKTKDNQEKTLNIDDIFEMKKPRIKIDGELEKKNGFDGGRNPLFNSIDAIAKKYIESNYGNVWRSALEYDKQGNKKVD